jgi:hypothetical protein
MCKVEARINEEADRATHYLDESTEARIVEVSKRTLLRDLCTNKEPESAVWWA